MQPVDLPIRPMSQLPTEKQQDILQAVCYYAVFKYPLTYHEIWENSSYTSGKEEFSKDLQALVNLNLLTECQGFYLLKGVTSIQDIENRLAGEKKHPELLPLAQKYTRFIASFPFVKAIGISGSYSKGIFDQGHDLDFFVITTPGRLWICRSLLRGYKKFFMPAAKVKFFCLNYFIDASQLTIPDQNLFVATEIRTLFPAWNIDLIQSFWKQNHWTHNYLPNKATRQTPLIQMQRDSFLKTVLQYILSGTFGNWLEERMYHFMLKRRKKRFKHMNQEEFDVNMRTRKEAEKHHPHGTQQKVLHQLHILMNSFVNPENQNR